jgi:5'(3')-deoxyribonucleotidase
MTVMATEKLPYDAKHIVYRDDGTVVHAFWTSDPEAARQLADRRTPNKVVNRLYYRDDVEVIATATRYYKALDGTDFSGWVVASVSDYSNYTDPIPNKREAMKALRGFVAECFNR